MDDKCESNEIIIIGSGPAGLSLALQLQRFGVKHRIIDKRTKRQTLTKAFATHSRTMEVFEDMGIFDQIVDKSVPVNEMNIYSDLKKLIHYNFKSLDVPYQFATSIPQCDVEGVLELNYERLGGKVERGIELLTFSQDSTGVSVLLERTDSSGDQREEEKRYRYLVACDGVNSKVRDILNIECRGAEYKTPYIIADGVLTWDKDRDAGHIYVSSGGYLLFVPMPGGIYRVVIDEPTGKITPENITTEIVNEYILKKGLKGVVFSSPSWLTVTRFRHGLIDNYQHNNVFLVGDACHVHSPIGAQGMNTGIQDSYNLAWKIAHTLHNGAEQELLASYHSERRVVAELVIKRTKQQMTLLTMKNPLVRMIRDIVVPRLARTKRFQEKVMTQAAGFMVNYWGSEAVSRSAKQTQAKSIVGRRMEDVYLFDTSSRSGNKKRLFDLMIGTHYSLFVIGDKSLVSAAEFLGGSRFHRSEFLRIYGVIDNFSNPIFEHKNSIVYQEILCDIDGELAEKCKLSENFAVLVRPDGYVALECSITDLNQFLVYMDGLYKNFTVPDTHSVLNTQIQRSSVLKAPVEYV